MSSPGPRTLETVTIRNVRGVGTVVCVRLHRHQASVSRLGVYERERSRGFTNGKWLPAHVLRGDRPSFFIRGPVRLAAVRIYREQFASKARPVTPSPRIVVLARVS